MRRIHWPSPIIQSGLLFLFLIPGGCATTGSASVRPGKAAALRAANSVTVKLFTCTDEIIAAAIRNVILEELLPTGITIIEGSGADIQIQGTITFTTDTVSAPSLISQAGRYVSGITAQLHQGSELVASVSETQLRTDVMIPGPPEWLAHRLGRRIRRLLR